MNLATGIDVQGAFVTILVVPSEPRPGGGGGGGGADSAGSGTTPGSGKINPISGSTQGELSGGVYYLAGGGGGGNQSGGLGGGGNFVSSANSSTNGTNGTGGGGGGHFDNGNGNIYQNGGSGVIILKYKSEDLEVYSPRKQRGI